MTDPSFTTTLQLAASPAVAFTAINDPRRWWSADIEGVTDQLESEFVFEVPGIHFTRFRITELVPERRVVWHAEEARLSFVADSAEWTGTDVQFDLASTDKGTELIFTHAGLVPESECYDTCATAWTSYIRGSLASLAQTGIGDPNQERTSGALNDIAEAARSTGPASGR